MPRPTQRKDGVIRDITHPVKFTKAEYGRIKRRAYEASVSVAEFIRSRVLRREVTPPPEPTLLDEKLAIDLHSMGVKLNSMTKALNRSVKADSGVYLSEQKFPPLCQEIASLMEEITKQLASGTQSAIAIEPRYKDNSLKVHTRSIRLATDEYEQLKEKARQARTSVSELMRRAALGLRLVSPPPPPPLNWKLYSSLGRVAHSLTQIEKALGQAAAHKQDMNVNPDETRRLISKLLQPLQTTRLQLLCASGESEDEEVIA